MKEKEKKEKRKALDGKSPTKDLGRPKGKWGGLKDRGRRGCVKGKKAPLRAVD